MSQLFMNYAHNFFFKFFSNVNIFLKCIFMCSNMAPDKVGKFNDMTITPGYAIY